MGQEFHLFGSWWPKVFAPVHVLWCMWNPWVVSLWGPLVFILIAWNGSLLFWWFVCSWVLAQSLAWALIQLDPFQSFHLYFLGVFVSEWSIEGSIHLVLLVQFVHFHSFFFNSCCFSNISLFILSIVIILGSGN